ncbi:HET-domain-containing protein [Hypoxylon sp. FL1284]|nr:HET-domain-containing protein [Hypoxylon sp. FL1284]
MSSFIAGQLCSRCQVLAFDDLAIGGAICNKPGKHRFGSRDCNATRHTTAYELRDALPALPVLTESIRQSRCAFCQILKASILTNCPHGLHGPIGAIRVSLQLVFSSEGNFMSVLARVGKSMEAEGGTSSGCDLVTTEHVNRHPPRSDRDEVLLLFGVDSLPNDPSSRWLGLQSSPQSVVFSNKTASQVRRMLQDAENPETGSFYPTRLIQVGGRDEDFCRLVPSHTHQFRQAHHRPKYAALSYCWGPAEHAALQFRTELATYQNRTAGFSLSTTSQVMQDAVDVCRSLDIPYLWVDAVCIIQDDKADWERESAQMADIYQNAYITICTPTSTSCREGFLGERPSASIPFRSRIDPDIVGSYTIRPCGAISDPQIAEAGYERIDNGDTSPRSNWWKRGWTFQELALSPRALLFGTKVHLVFEDRFWSEGDDEMTVGDAADEHPGFGGLGGTFAVVSVADTLNAEGNEHVWMSMVEQYTARQLTFESDKLPAMGGLAKIAVLGLGDVYLAGIRREFLHRDLFWTPARDAESRKIVSFGSLLASLNAPSPYIAPSWSWARWQGKIRFDESPAPFGDHVPVMQYQGSVERAYKSVEAWMSASKLNPFGQVTAGGLRLTGKVVPVLSRLEAQEGIENHWEMFDEAGDYVANVTFDWDEPEGWVPTERLSLVLIGSYWSWQAYKTAKLYDGATADDASSDEDMNDDTNIDHADDVDTVSSEEDESMDDDMSSEDTELTYEEAFERDQDVDKFAYGLIIHEAEAQGKYFRVGIFSSWPKGKGGLRHFKDDYSTKTVEVV